MKLTFEAPLWGLLAVGLVVPLLVLAVAERRARRLLQALSLRRPPIGALLVPAVALCAVPGLLGFAAAQPVLHRTKTRYVRTDAEAFFVFDTSRSMLASRGRGSATRFERARRAGLRLRAELGDVPVGVASLTDRLLPHLFPSASEPAFAGTLERAIGVERPPPQQVQARATSYFALSALATQNYFSTGARRRLAVVFTDGESTPFEETELTRDFREASHITPIFVRFWNADERIFLPNGKVEVRYHTDPASQAFIERLAATLGGSVFEEGDLGAVTRSARVFLGHGPRVPAGRVERRIALAPYAAAAAFLPLAYLLWRRNLWGLALRFRRRLAKPVPGHA